MGIRRVSYILSALKIFLFFLKKKGQNVEQQTDKPLKRNPIGEAVWFLYPESAG